MDKTHNTSYNFVKILLFFIFQIFSLSFYGQVPKVMISLEKTGFYSNINNAFRIVAQQNKPISLNQLSAKLETYNKNIYDLKIIEGNGYFTVHPDSIGEIIFNIKLTDTIVLRKIAVKPIKATGRLGRYRANSDVKINVGVFKLNSNLIANVECCDMDAKCKVLGFEIIRIPIRGKVEKNINSGGKFNLKTKEIISHTRSKDIFIFKRIKYKCPSADRPQRLEDMVIDIE